MPIPKSRSPTWTFPVSPKHVFACGSGTGVASPSDNDMSSSSPIGRSAGCLLGNTGVSLPPRSRHSSTRTTRSPSKSRSCERGRSLRSVTYTVVAVVASSATRRAGDGCVSRGVSSRRRRSTRRTFAAAPWDLAACSASALRRFSAFLRCFSSSALRFFSSRSSFLRAARAALRSASASAIPGRGRRVRVGLPLFRLISAPSPPISAGLCPERSPGRALNAAARPVAGDHRFASKDRVWRPGE
mmetsp:Transcript_3492/g.10306  ORF Transcript_3492/g.10306 Transcript_3492/m.10306 type:complete len:243 (+) Transcript_3492:98-826(+)